MDYQSSCQSQKKQSPTGSNTASLSRQAVPTTSVPLSLRYFTASARSSTPYESPYALNQDRRSQPPSDSSTSLYPTLSGPSNTRAHHSKQNSSSSSSGGSIYEYSVPRGSRNTTPIGTMSSQRNMSSVSLVLHLFIAVCCSYIPRSSAMISRDKKLLGNRTLQSFLLSARQFCDTPV